jgi:hypothetical protein
MTTDIPANSPEITPAGSARIKSELTSFALIYLVGLVIGHVLTQLFSLNAISSISAVVLFVGAYVAVAKFIEANGRIPDGGEKWRLIVGSLTIVWAVWIPVMALLIAVFAGRAALMNLASLYAPAQWVVVVIVMSALYTLLLYIVYGWNARQIIEKRRLLGKDARGQ